MDIICPNCGSQNHFYTKEAGPHTSAYCLKCDSYIKHLPKDKPTVIHFGKHKGKQLSELTSDDDLRYLKWLSGSDQIKDRLKQAILDHIKNH